jgi:SAM-dependent methyltransferase
MDHTRDQHPVHDLSDADLVDLCASVHPGADEKRKLHDLLTPFELARVRQSFLLVPPTSEPGAMIVDIGPAIHWLPVYRWLGYSRIACITKLDDDPNLNDAALEGWSHADMVEVHCVDAERGRFPLDDEQARVVGCFETLEHLAADPMHMLSEVNRVLPIGGKLALSTPNIACWVSAYKALRGKNPNNWSPYATDPALSEVRHHREYTASEVGSLARAAGLRVDRLWTPKLEHRKGVMEATKRAAVKTALFALRGSGHDAEPLTFLGATKTSAVVDRHPPWLYSDFLSDAAGFG